MRGPARPRYQPALLRDQRAFRKAGLFGRTAPFIAVTLVVAALLPFRTELHGSALLLALGLIAVLIAAIFSIPWERLPRWTDATIPLAYFVVVALLRDAEGGSTATTGALVFLPVVWFALFGNRREVLISICAAVGVFVVPVLVIGAPQYPLSELGKALNLCVVVGMVAYVVYRLVGERAELLEQLYARAHHDPLTSLRNRRAWGGDLEDAMMVSSATGDPLCVALLDMDGLKSINDQSGHEAGDRALISVSDAWSRVVPENSVLARFGGDEFGLLLPGSTAEGAQIALDRLTKAAQPYRFSIGLAQFDAPESSGALMRRADHALYEAKAARPKENRRPASRQLVAQEA